MSGQIQPAYPVLESAGEVAVVDGMPGDVHAESVRCVCGNDIASDGFAAIGSDGRFAWLGTGPAPDGLTAIFGFACCHVCGRVYDDGDLERGPGAESPVVLRYDTASAEWATARALYWTSNGF